MRYQENPKLDVGVQGLMAGVPFEGGRLLWKRPLSKNAVALRGARQKYKHVRLVVVIVLAILFLGLFAHQTMQASLTPALTFLAGAWWFSESSRYLWLGLAFAAYGISLLMRHENTIYQVADVFVEKEELIELAFNEVLLDIIDESCRIAQKVGSAELSVMHFLAALGADMRVQNMMVRLSLAPKTIFTYAHHAIAKQGAKQTTVPASAYALLFAAFIEADKTHQFHVRAEDLLLVCVRELPELQDMLYEQGVTMEQLEHVVGWMQSSAQLRDQQELFRKAARSRPTTGLDRAMTAVATPLLNSYSKDVTLSAQFGYIGAIVGRGKTVDGVLQHFEGGAPGVLLIGEAGVGKTAIVEAIAQRMVLEDVPKNLKDKRMIELQISALLSGASASQAGERLLAMLSEVQQARNVVMFIPDIHTLVAAREGGEGAINVAGVLKEVVERSGIPVVGTTTPEFYRKVIKGSVLETLLTSVDIAPMDVEHTISVLQAKVGVVEYKQKVYFTYKAVQALAQHAFKHMQNAPLPKSAIDLMKEVAVSVKNKKGEKTLVMDADVAAVVADKTNIPVTAITAEEGDKLLQLEEQMHKRVIGQDEAVAAVSNALRRARAKLSSGKRPIANFLFVGPTGVGKTELAKTIASVYFGGEERMLRFDMSEYQDGSSIYRLIGQPDKQGSGALTEAVRENPFSLLLLDELEKADKQVLNIFLQVMDDGRITDSVGRVVDFTNVILIATSNAASQYIADQVQAKTPYDQVVEGLLQKELRNHYTPEFLNRFDGVIAFHPLSLENTVEIAGLMVGSLAKKIEKEYGAKLTLTQGAKQELAQQGYDPQFGARPMRRAIQEHVENAVAKVLLEQQVGRGSVITYDAGGKVTVMQQ